MFRIIPLSFILSIRINMLRPGKGKECQQSIKSASPCNIIRRIGGENVKRAKWFVPMLLIVVLLSSSCIWLFLSCVDFEGPAVGTTYYVGDTTTLKFTKLTFEGFYWLGSSTPTLAGEAAIHNNLMAGHTGKDLNLNNISVRFEFKAAYSKLTLYFGEYGGNINLTINGILKNTNDFLDLDGSTVGGVLISVTMATAEKGLLTLEGNIHSFSVGGQELWIDHVCPEK